MTRRDITIVCKDCGRNFIFRGEEQDFFAEKGYSEPTRCRTCRTARKNGGTQGNGRPSRENAPGGHFSERALFPAVCAACGEHTQVPFKPKEGRPVLCRNCFSNQK